MHSVLYRRCWLGDRKGIWPVKTEWWGAGMVICLERNADLHMAHLMPLSLTVSCSVKIHIGFTFLVPAHPGSPGQRAFKQVCMCVCVLKCFSLYTVPVMFCLDDVFANVSVCVYARMAVSALAYIQPCCYSSFIISLCITVSCIWWVK